MAPPHDSSPSIFNSAPAAAALQSAATILPSLSTASAVVDAARTTDIVDAALSPPVSFYPQPSNLVQAAPTSQLPLPQSHQLPLPHAHQHQYEQQYHFPVLEQQPYYHPSHLDAFDSGDGWVSS
jgi:hypothetical protein